MILTLSTAVRVAEVVSHALEMRKTVAMVSAVITTVKSAVAMQHAAIG